MVLFAIILTLFCLVGWIIGAMRPHRRAWISIGVAPGVIVLGFHFFAVCRHITPSFETTGNLGVHWFILVFMIGGFIALLSQPKTPKKPADDNHDGAAHA